MGDKTEVKRDRVKEKWERNAEKKKKRDRMGVTERGKKERQVGSKVSERERENK